MQRVTVSSSRSAFTLIETIIAAAILVVVMSGAIGLNRTLLESGQKREQLAQMNALADAAVANLYALRDYAREQRIPLSQLVGNTSTPSFGSFLANRSGSSLDHAGQNTLYYCPQNRPDLCLNRSALVSYVSSTPTVHSVYDEVHQFFVKHPSANPYSSGNLYGDFVAIRKSNADTANLRQVIDRSVYTDTESYADGKTPLVISTAGVTNQWDIYVRAVSFEDTSRHGGPQGLTFNQSVDGGTVQAMANPMENQLQSRLYVCKVLITSFTNPQLQVQREIFIADYTP